MLVLAVERGTGLLLGFVRWNRGRKKIGEGDLLMLASCQRRKNKGKADSSGGRKRNGGERSEMGGGGN